MRASTPAPESLEDFQRRRALEVYSRFAEARYDLLPCHNEPAESPLSTPAPAHDYPLVLTRFACCNSSTSSTAIIRAFATM